MNLKNIMRINQILSKIKTTSNFQLDWKIADYICASRPHVDFYNSKLNELFDKCGERDENNNLVYVGNGIQIKEDKIKEVTEKINELDSVEVEFSFNLTQEELSRCNLEISDLVFIKTLSN